MTRSLLCLGLLATCLPCIAADAPTPTLDELLRPRQNDIVTISPEGRYIAATTRLGDRSVLAIINRATLKPERVLDPDQRGAISQMEWASDRRVLVRSSHVGDMVEQAYLDSFVVAVDVDGGRKREFGHWVVDTLTDDDEHLLIARCARANSNGCWSYIQKVDTLGGSSGPRLLDGPAPGVSYTTDGRGDVRFASSTSDEGIQKVWMHDGKAWRTINDESASGVEVVPLGGTASGTSGYLLSEQTDGPDVIERIEFASGKRETVLRDDRLDPARILWSVDGREPIGAAFGLGRPRARFWNAEHPDARLLRKLEAAFPEDAVAFVSGTRDGTQAIVRVTSDRDPGSFYLLDRSTLKSELLAREMPWLDPAQLAHSTAFELAARDGTKLTGFLTRPRHTGSDAPLVVLPHGGPFGVKDDWFYDEETQILAAHGYAVLRVNFRGSSGFGRGFIARGFRKWGGAMQDDLTDATRWAQMQTGIDGARTCIFGSSYGGYAALMGIAREPGLYRCAISTAGVTDLKMQWRWGDVQRSRWGRTYLDEALGRDQKALHEASPVRFAAQFTTPLMLVHGVHDERVPFEHARSLRAILDDAGIEYEGYFPKDETHGIHGLENRIEYYTKVLDFLRRHIGGVPVRRSGT